MHRYMDAIIWPITFDFHGVFGVFFSSQSVSVNCAHLHPKFGTKTPEEELRDLAEEDQSGEIDLNLQEYKERRLQARRSPYPSVVIEVRSMPPPDFSQAPPPSKQQRLSSSSSSSSSSPPSGPTSPPKFELDADKEQTNQDGDDDEEEEEEDHNDGPSSLHNKEITSDFIQQLEALFSKSAHVKEEQQIKKKDEFYDSIASHIEEISAVTPLMLAQAWISQHDPDFNITTSAFTVSDTQHVDEAYEFVFTNLAMQTSAFLEEEEEEEEEEDRDRSNTNTNTNTTTASSRMVSGAQKRHYLVLPHFMTSSATSLEKFGREVTHILQTLPSLHDKVIMSSFHPEHVDPMKRSPVPVFILQWQDE